MGPLNGQVTYVDATTANTKLADGSSYAPTASQNNTDNQWSDRSFGNSAQVYTANDNNANPGEDAPEIRTTISLLTPGETYRIFVYYWTAGNDSPTGNQQWDIAAGFSSGSTTAITAAAGTNLGSTIGHFTSTVLVTESDRRLREFFLGNAVADASGNIDVYINDLPGNSNRTWYDGVGFELGTTNPPVDPGNIREIAPDGAWTWFNDERSIFHQGFLFSGYVKGNGQYGITRYDPVTDSSDHMIISTPTSQQTDDHNNPSLTVLPDGRLLAVYSKHAAESKFYYRTSKVAAPSSISDWNSEQSKATPATATYANAYRLSGESNLIYNFNRCINYNPTLTLSSDDGTTWGTPTQLIDAGTGNVRPYVRYCSNLKDRIDLIYTDGHPRDINNSVYHLYYRAGNLCRTDGTVIDSLANIPIQHDLGERGSVVYPYTSTAWGEGEGPDDWIPMGRGWTLDLQYGAGGNPVCAFQVQRDGASWTSDRIHYYYARWTGTSWQRRFIAHAGRPLYSAEDDYSGGMAIDPDDPRIVYISTNAANPFELGDIVNVPLAANSRYEIWRGFTADGGLTFTWTPVTENSASDNLRPIVPGGHGRSQHVIWFQGTYSTYKVFSTRVMGQFGEPVISYSDWAEDRNLAVDSWSDDEDHDGIANLIEYGTDTDPNSPASRSAPVLTPDGFEFQTTSSRNDVEWQVEASSDLERWDTAAIVRAGSLPDEVESGYSLEQLPDSSGMMRLRITGSNPDHLFFRLQARLVD
jgi:hypothetical protein